MSRNLGAPVALVLLVIAAADACASRRAASEAAAPERARAPHLVRDREPVEKKALALLAQWKPKFDEEKLNYLAAGPFVIAGNGSKQRIERYRDDTVLAASRALHAMFFDREPEEPILVLLFESRGPYARLAKEWFGDEDVPHYGFFRRRENVMLMNVGTGTGTLVHELVHALIASDFPDVPHWFNEGLGSLFEQCAIGRDHQTITGLVNWRLPALKKAIREERLRPLRELIGDGNFYDGRLVGMNYAQARYLLMYLQERGLLRGYYARLREGAADDPTGLKALEAVVGPKSLEAFEKQWRAWVMTLHFS